VGGADVVTASAELKWAQKKLVELRYQQLAGQLLSMADVEAVWGDLVTTTKWLFLALPQRARELRCRI
jgi:hypothetical protein